MSSILNNILNKQTTKKAEEPTTGNLIVDFSDARKRIAALQGMVGESRKDLFTKQGDKVTLGLKTYITRLEEFLTGEEPSKEEDEKKRKTIIETATVELDDAKEALRAYDPATNRFSKLSKKRSELSNDLRKIMNCKVELSRLEQVRAVIGQGVEDATRIMGGKAKASVGAGRITVSKMTERKAKDPKVLIENYQADGLSREEAGEQVKADFAQQVDAIA